ncbi:MAG: chromosome segregation protein SMC [Thiohalophilus sp.]|jgi:chromosome segregation protein
MRLTKLKLSGFKSFVDPTTVPLPSTLVGVVGPNGCGKSNIIDAVRWVMGESSAKHLRGDSMADVIFNGSTSRKPVGQATVELVFDNSDGSVGGQYANYNEISIKRTVTRDGQSIYHLNGTRCRRRDITDIFLGTGLGPRSYAIIEQGTISRIIEAKPEELRVFLEEAAGISKYKERRRETENRIRHTRENLDRLGDLRDELDKQISRLQRQARTAERYKVLKQEERLMKAQLQSLRWKGVDDQARESDNAIREQETALEAAIAKQRHIEADIENQRGQHTEASDKFNEVQSRFYSIGADIARLEQSIQHARERRTQQKQDLEQIEKDWSDAQIHVEADRRRIEELEAGLKTIEPDLQSAEQREQAVSEALQSAEQAMQEWQQAWDDFNQESAEPARQAEVERTRIQHLEQKLTQVQQRLEKAEQDLQQQSPERVQQEVTQLESQLTQTGEQVEQAQRALSEKQDQIAALRDSTHQVNADLDQARSRLQDLRGRSASLEALQQAALGKDAGAVNDWLSGQRLQDAPRLAEEMDVDAGWERAVECVLGGHLEAVCVAGVDPLTEVLGSLQEGTLTLFDTQAGGPASNLERGTPLRDKIRAPWSLDALLGTVYAAESLAEALAMRTQLAAYESVVTREGIWLGPTWLRVVKEQEQDQKAGILKREQELKALDTQIQEENQRVQALQEQLDRERERLRELEQERDDAQAQLNQASRRQAEQQSELKARQDQMEQVQARQQALQKEQQDLHTEIERERQELQSSRGRLETALNNMSGLEQQREQLSARRDELRNNLEQARDQSQVVRSEAHEIKLRAEKQRTELNSTRQALERLDNQLKQLSGRREELQNALHQSDEPIEQMNKELAEKLDKRVAVETELGEARQAMENIEHLLRELEEQRATAEQQVQEVRSKLEQIRIHQQEFKVRRQTLEEQITESGFQLQQLLQEMPAEAEVGQWQENVDQLDAKIQRLGPINLAAIEEFEQQSERKQYLDAQNEDLFQALKTLEDAIHKIDKETRTRFKETYDKVNSGLKELFPRLFGGGHAYLEMTGEDLLETGVTVMARPPGKRNSTIHLLSGGEKALTAVALVFAIFELNPAPFCMLDEVDAPLDDANVSRYCDLLRHMSDKTQFIFITHNKVTMEVANHLTGVTMHEPGVSRMVAVDVDEAAKLASA